MNKESTLKKWDLDSLSNGDLQQQIDRQAEQYNQLKSRSATIVQFIIALGALVVTFASGQVFETSEAIINALTTQSPQFSYQIPGINNYDFGQISEPMAVLILFVGVLFFVDTIFWAGDVLTYRPLEPLLGRKESLNSHIDTMETELYQISPLDHKRDRLKYAVLTNDSSLRNMTSCLNYCYTVLAFGLGTFVYAGLVYVSGLSDRGDITALASFVAAIIIFLVVIVLIYRVYNISRQDDSKISDIIRKTWEISPNPMRHLVIHLFIFGIVSIVSLPAFFVLTSAVL